MNLIFYFNIKKTLILICLFASFQMFAHKNCYNQDIVDDIIRFDLTRKYDLDESLLRLKELPFLAVSLGSNCHIAQNLKEFGLRMSSFPFDWNVTPFDSLCKMIENNFEELIDRKHFTIKNGGPGLYNNKYGCWLAHDFHDDRWYNDANGIATTDCVEALAHVEVVREYYKRRIQRFNKIFELGIPIYLFRRRVTASQAQILQNLLKSRFPNSNFKLVCIEDEESKPFEPIQNWNIADIIHYRIEYAHIEPSCVGPATDCWRALLKDLGLIK